jgi:hypothetical protein
MHAEPKQPERLESAQQFKTSHLGTASDRQRSKSRSHDKPPPTVVVEHINDIVLMKRARSTVAAHKSRERRRKEREKRMELDNEIFEDLEVKDTPETPQKTQRMEGLEDEQQPGHTTLSSQKEKPPPPAPPSFILWYPELPKLLWLGVFEILSREDQSPSPQQLEEL